MYHRLVSVSRAVQSQNGVNLRPMAHCNSGSCRWIPFCTHADLREIRYEQWASHDALMQSACGISNSSRDHGDANSALKPLLELHIPGQMRLYEDGYSTGNLAI